MIQKKFWWWVPYWPVPLCHELSGILYIGLPWQLAQDIEWMCLTIPRNKFLMYRVQVLYISVSLVEVSMLWGWAGEAGVKCTTSPDQQDKNSHRLTSFLPKKGSLLIFSYLLSDLESFTMKNSEYQDRLVFISLVNSADGCLCVAFPTPPPVSCSRYPVSSKHRI